MKKNVLKLFLLSLLKALFFLGCLCLIHPEREMTEHLQMAGAFGVLAFVLSFVFSFWEKNKPTE